MALAYLTINLDAFTGDDHPPVPSYSTITLDPGADHIDAAADVIHVRTIVVSLDRQGKAASANGVPCVDGKVPVVAGVAYAVSAPNVLRGGPHYIPALTAGQVVDLSDYITPGAPLTPDQASVLAAQIADLSDAVAPDLTAYATHAQVDAGDAATLAAAQAYTDTHGGTTGTGSPEGVVTATPGTEYLDTAGTLGAWRWLKTSGTGTTGWKVTYGDTGWRNMQAEFESICTANSLTFSVAPGYHPPKIRRVGDFLILDVGVNITGSGSATIDFRSAFGQNLNGFRGGPNNRQIPASVTGSAGVIHWAQYTYIKFWSPGLQTLNVVWPITDTAVWPTTLPGTPA